MVTKLDRLKEIADEIAASLEELARRESSAKEGSPNAQNEKAALKGAANRAKALSSGRIELGLRDCINCFIVHDVTYVMTPIPSDRGNVDLFRCHNCGDEIEIEA